ncbi:MAG: DUF1343 domain-containing protein [Chloroherpetonaceae bacterium]|nr:DUF1343 domain-containing protein [Chloroherpetonaceae bacterium]
MRKVWFFFFLPIVTASLAMSQSPKPTVKLGLEVFLEELNTTYKAFAPPIKKSNSRRKKAANPSPALRFGLITNHTGIDSKGIPNYERLKAAGVNLTAIFAPEHGFSGNLEAGAKVKDSTLGTLSIYSLYGKTRKPTPIMMAEIDVLIFDIFDIGTRTYTYISTLALAIEAAAEAKKPLLVFDRPNPIAPIPAQGPQLEPELRSFVGRVTVPFVHARTVGEIAKVIQQTEFPKAKLTVVPMKGYDKTKFYDEMGLPFIPPSPNITTLETALIYPATVLIEGTNISEGRGTLWPFEQIGAPKLDAAVLKRKLLDSKISGVVIDTVSFTPRVIAGKAESPKYRDTMCTGVRFSITDRKAYKPFDLALKLLKALKSTYPAFSFPDSGKFFDRLAGTKKIREEVIQE